MPGLTNSFPSPEFPGEGNTHIVVVGPLRSRSCRRHDLKIGAGLGGSLDPKRSCPPPTPTIQVHGHLPLVLTSLPCPIPSHTLLPHMFLVFLFLL